MKSQELLEQLLDAGLIQFGLYHTDTPIVFHLDHLAAYPELLNKATEMLIRTGGSSNDGVERVLVTQEGIALGVAYSLFTRIPLVYSRSGHTRRDLVGAYDMGHPTRLIVNTIGRGAMESVSLLDFVAGVRQIGLQVIEVVSLLQVGTVPAQSLSVPVYTGIDLVAALPYLAQRGHLSRVMAEEIEAWANRRRGSTAP